MPYYIYCGYYLIIINLIAIIVTIYDKHQSKKHLWRVPENTLLFISIIGGSPAMLITMKLIRHKTQHKKFMIGIPVIIIFQALTAYFIFK